MDKLHLDGFEMLIKDLESFVMLFDLEAELSDQPDFLSHLHSCC